MSDLLVTLLRLNLAVAAAVALAMLLRLPARRLFGARIAYGLWSLVPLAALAMLLPARIVTVVQAEAPSGAPQVLPSIASMAGASPTLPPPEHGLWSLLAALGIAGAAASLLYLVWRQAQFGRAIREGRAGPAVIGVLRPRIVVPDDFAQRYTPREQLVVLAHERTHIARHDSRINAVVALLRCAAWFNPLVHVLAHVLRIDQELACDAQVVAAHPKARRAYAEAMLKTQLAARPLPIGCYWPAQSAHPLAQRIGLLSRKTPGYGRRLAGAAAVALVGVGVGLSAWAARPPQVVAEPAPRRPETAWTPRAPDQPQPPPLALRSTLAARRAPALVETGGPAASGPTASRQDATPPAPAQAAEAPPLPRSFRVYGVADRSAVEPGSAVRVLATMTDREGAPLTTDLTAFGSQTAYRAGYYEHAGSRYSLFTSVVQQGGRFLVAASLNRRFSPEVSGVASLAAGETGSIVLGDGQVVTVTPWIRPETPQEVEEASALCATATASARRP